MSNNNSPVNCPLCLRPIGPKGGNHKAQCKLCGYSPEHVRTWIEAQERPEPTVAVKAARVERNGGGWVITAHVAGIKHRLVQDPAPFGEAASLAKQIATSGAITPSRWEAMA